MPNIIPPLLSSTPPPIVDDEEDDEFGDFRAGVDLSFGCDGNGLSLPSTPEHLQKNRLLDDPLDVNSNSEEQLKVEEKSLEKDFQDKRKSMIHLSSNYNAPNGVISDFTEQISLEPKTLALGEECDVTTTSDLFKTENDIVDDDNKDVFDDNSDSLSQSEVKIPAESRSEDLNSLEVEEIETCNKESGENHTFEFSSENFVENVTAKSDSLEIGDFATNNATASKEQISTDIREHCEEDLHDDFDNFETKNCEQSFVENTENPVECFQEASSKNESIEDDFASFEEYSENISDFDLHVKTKDDFGDFEKCTDTDNPWGATSSYIIKSDNEDDDFGNFENCSFNIVNSETTRSNEDDFGDFEKCSSQQNDDEFGDFGSASFSECKVDEYADIERKAEEVITGAFPLINVESQDYTEVDFVEGNPIFDSLKDIMETNALKFHWVSSSSQKTLLKALNIDMRNILYGPGWNLGVPKFATLEPLKPEILTPEVVSPKPQPQSESIASFPTDVPSAQFDWTSAGLTNPLDSAQDDQQSNNSINLDWNFLETTKTDSFAPQKESPAPSLNFEVNLDSLSIKSEGDIDTQREHFQEDVAHLTNMIPLRETHICEENTSKEIAESIEDDFDDFQMSLPVAIEKEVEFDKFQSVTKPQQCLQPLPAEPLKPVVVHANAPAKIEWPAPGLSEDDIQSIEFTYTKQPMEAKQEEKNKKHSVEDDDWTDFISHKETVKTSPERVQNNLQLSVFNLGNIQPIKPPVPVITPQGLIQTKLSSTGTISPLMSSPVHKKQLSVRPPDGYQPSVISRQFMDNTNQNCSAANSAVSLNNYNLHPSPYNHNDSLFVPSANTSKCDEDDWTDFISSQPVEQQSVSFTPNIIANPNRYDPLREFRLNGSVLNNSKKSTYKGSVPSVTTLPDLDFVITKNRTFAKK